MLLVPYAIARVFVLDLNSALCGSNWKGPPLIADVKSPLSPTTGVLSVIAWSTSSIQFPPSEVSFNNSESAAA